MTNGQNVARSRHLEELAQAAKRYTLREILDVTEAVATKLGGLSIANYADATTVSSGLMSATDKAKLDNLTNYTLPTASTTTKGGVKIGSGLSMDGDTLSVTLQSGSSGSSGGTVLDTVPSTVDGGIWYEVTDNLPTLWLHKGNYDYGYTGFNQQRFTGTADKRLAAYLPFDISPTFDACGNEWTASGNVSLDTTIKKFGSASVHLPAGAYLSASDILNPAADAWSFDCFVYTVFRAPFLGIGTSGNNSVGIYVEGSYMWHGNNGWVKTEYSPVSDFSLNDWSHVAVTKNGTTVYFFVDGGIKKKIQLTTSNALGTGRVFTIGGTTNGEYSGDFYVDNVRFFDGVALWTENFTPPIADDYL